MYVRVFGLLMLALSSLALPHIAHDPRANDGRRMRTAADCAAALRIILPNAHVTATSAAPAGVQRGSYSFSRRSSAILALTSRFTSMTGRGFVSGNRTVPLETS